MKETVYFMLNEGTEWDPGEPSITVVSKKYWEENNCIDDGYGETYMDIHEDLHSLGFSELTEGVYEFPYEHSKYISNSEALKKLAESKKFSYVEYDLFSEFEY